MQASGRRLEERTYFVYSVVTLFYSLQSTTIVRFVFRGDCRLWCYNYVLDIVVLAQYEDLVVIEEAEDIEIIEQKS